MASSLKASGRVQKSSSDPKSERLSMLAVVGGETTLSIISFLRDFIDYKTIHLNVFGSV